MALPGLFAQDMQRQVWMAVNAGAAHPQEVEMIVAMVINTFEERREWFG